MLFNSQITFAETTITPTNTLPAIYITTAGKSPVVSKEDYMEATYYITVPENSQFPPVGSISDQRPLKIRGRGNASWTAVKKPYKLKLGQKTVLLNMPAHRDFSLLACYGGAYDLSMLSYLAGLKIAELTGMGWVPEATPVELVLNNEYQGLYLLIESIKVDRNRLDINAQPDYCEDLTRIDDGWLVELDNYADTSQILVPEFLENRVGKMRVTSKVPEFLSEVQKQWLENEFSLINELMQLPVKTPENDWANHIDPASFAKYFIVREMIHDTDGYSGSFYLSKDKSRNSKWVCGPIWDIFNITLKDDWVMNDHPAYAAVHWVPYITKTTRFHRSLSHEWKLFYNKLDSLTSYLDSFISCSAADSADAALWNRNGNTEAKITRIKRYLTENAEWINEHVDSLAHPVNAFEISINDRKCYFGTYAKSFTIMSVTGQIILAGERCYEADLRHIPHGLYFVKAESYKHEVAAAKFLMR